jgi:hypothetical protein
MTNLTEADEDTIERASELLPQHQRASFKRSVTNMLQPKYSNADLSRIIRLVLGERGVAAAEYNNKRKHDYENQNTRRQSWANQGR